DDAVLCLLQPLFLLCQRCLLGPYSELRQLMRGRALFIREPLYFLGLGYLLALRFEVSFLRYALSLFGLALLRGLLLRGLLLLFLALRSLGLLDLGAELLCLGLPCGPPIADHFGGQPRVGHLVGRHEWPRAVHRVRNIKPVTIRAVNSQADF